MADSVSIGDLEFASYYPPAMESEPPPPPPPSTDRFGTVVAVFIAVISIASAIVAWRASEASNAAQDLDTRAVQEIALQQQARQDLEGVVAQDQRLLARFQGHLVTAKQLRERAAEVRTENTDLANVLDLQAHSELAQARVLAPYFRGGAGFRRGLVLGPDELVAYDRDFSLRALSENEPTLRELKPDETLRRADVAHQKGLQLVGVTAVLIASLFFLTLASLGRRGLRAGFGVIGTAAAAAGLFLFVLAEFAP